ncbi:DUF3619 family protein [Curvibacter sp. CHRR-16]|uniref:DUF3619 family protein n=1 Tax=Curvibacter sp. CHRR-16 TaxID=2835872 RepID=UPI001BDA491B|nr:DUF3619 family protein [Curvibacter sp. CHRR-16]MBT0568778.1 DUF3619 family protein [Curvibacter sp. CHRR-16]
MTTQHLQTLSVTPTEQQAADALAHAVVRHLNHGAEQLPHDISQRLKAARSLALEKRRQSLVAAQNWQAQANGASASLTLTGGPSGLWRWLRPMGATAAFLLLMATWVAMDQWKADDYAQEVADVDTQILTGELPPSAYTDPGFAQFLRNNQSQ